MNDWKLLEKPLRGPIAVALSFGLASGVIAGWILGRWSLSFADVQWLDVMTAFGTVGAVIVALLLGTQSTRRQETERKAHEQILRSATAPELRLLLGHIEKVHHAASYLMRNAEDSDLKNWAQTVLIRFSNEPHLSVTERHFERLVHLPEKDAECFAQVLGLLPSLEKRVQDALSNWYQDDNLGVLMSILVDEAGHIGQLLLSLRREKLTTPRGRPRFPTSDYLNEHGLGPMTGVGLARLLEEIETTSDATPRA